MEHRFGDESCTNVCCDCLMSNDSVVLFVHWLHPSSSPSPRTSAVTTPVRYELITHSLARWRAHLMSPDLLSSVINVSVSRLGLCLPADTMLSRSVFQHRTCSVFS